MKEMTCNEFLKEMKAAGFTGTYRATNGKQTFTGTITADGEINSTKVPSSDESRQKIKDLFKRG
tara:strand:- start:233 stop:424 length:192 start_codon:yes stop_codon:yes gene_type:complete